MADGGAGPGPGAPRRSGPWSPSSGRAPSDAITSSPRGASSPRRACCSSSKAPAGSHRAQRTSPDLGASRRAWVRPPHPEIGRPPSPIPGLRSRYLRNRARARGWLLVVLLITFSPLRPSRGPRCPTNLHADPVLHPLPSSSSAASRPRCEAPTASCVRPSSRRSTHPRARRRQRRGHAASTRWWGPSKADGGVPTRPTCCRCRPRSTPGSRSSPSEPATSSGPRRWASCSPSVAPTPARWRGTSRGSSSGSWRTRRRGWPSRQRSTTSLAAHLRGFGGHRLQV
jgi:hypothetical protein